MNNETFQIIAFIIPGLAFIIGYSFVSKKNRRVMQNRIEAEGIVFEFQRHQSYYLNTSNNTDDSLTYPVIRFLTNEKKWITGKPVIDVSSSFFKIGQKVTVIYNGENPKNFFLKPR